MAVTSDSQTVCVLGGTGFVGRSICNLLAEQSIAMRIPTRRRQRHRRMLVLPGLDLIDADVHDEAALRDVLNGADAVINLVGILNEKGHDGSGFRKVHVELPQKLTLACRDLGIGRLLQMSALKANAERGPSHYLRTKGLGEQIVAELADGRIDYTFFRPSVIFGPEDDFLNRFARLLRMAPVLPMPRLGARFAPVYVGDVAAAFVEALNDSRTHGETYELCGPEIYTLEEVLDFIRRCIGVRRAVVGLPDPLGRVQAWLADYLIPGKPFSLDNMRSLSVASVCTDDGLRRLGIQAHAMPRIASEYLVTAPTRLSRFRRHTGH